MATANNVAVEIIQTTAAELLADLQVTLLQAIAFLSRLTWLNWPDEPEWTVDRLQVGLIADLRRPNAKLFVAQTAHGTPIGFVMAYEVFRSSTTGQMTLKGLCGLEILDPCVKGGGKIVYIDSLGVAPDYRRQGHGEALLERCLEAYEGEGVSLFLLRTRMDEEREPARRLFTKKGFVPLGVRGDADHCPEREFFLRVVD